MQYSPAQLVQRVLGLKRQYKIALAIVFLLFIILLFYPFQTVIVSAWPLKLVDDSGRPVGGINVTQHWQHYLLESEGHEELQVSDAEGSVFFPRRTVRAGMVARLFAGIGKLDKSGNERRNDPYASVVVWGSREYQVTTHVCQPGVTPPETIVVARVR